MLKKKHFLILYPVIPGRPFPLAFFVLPDRGREVEPKFNPKSYLQTGLMLLALILPALGEAAGPGTAEQREAFMQAWESARSGDRTTFERALGQQGDYMLYPYLLSLIHI